MSDVTPEVRTGEELTAVTADDVLAELLFAEKVREDAVRDVGLQVVRWISADLNQPDDLMERLNRAFDRGRRQRT